VSSNVDALDTIDEPVAGLGWRLGARVVDIVTFTWLTAFVLVEIDQRLLGGDPWGRRAVGIEIDSARPVVLVCILVLVYEVVPVVVFGATAGKAFFGLRVRRRSEDPVSDALAALARAVVLYGPPLVFGGPGALVVVVLLVSIVVPRSGRGLHDRLAGTTVVSIAER
jgi:uncharacterized RDD family membrane protein YckC